MEVWNTGPNALCNRQVVTTSPPAPTETRIVKPSEMNQAEHKRHYDEENEAPKKKYARYMETPQTSTNPLALGISFGKNEGKTRENDWICKSCNFKNFQKRSKCKKCKQDKKIVDNV